MSSESDLHRVSIVAFGAPCDRCGRTLPYVLPWKLTETITYRHRVIEYPWLCAKCFMRVVATPTLHPAPDDAQCTAKVGFGEWYTMRCARRRRGESLFCWQHSRKQVDVSERNDTRQLVVEKASV